ncbi:MAG: hypothetical protein NT094_03135, partial [Candidatus Staskawiczbacteria bacterium]|nr:hypothetical protein [Candidatus Staskawiczbacteria bacterium]
FGKIKKIRPLLFINDYDRQDKTVAGFLQFEKCSQFHLVATDQRYFFTFELDVICEKARLRFINEGFSLAIQLVVPDKVFTGYKILGDSKLRKTKLDLAISEMVKNAVDHLDKQKSLFSTIENAWETQKICNKLLEKYV